MISSEQMPVDLTVGIIVRNGRPFLRHCLQSIDRLSDQDFSVMVVDSGSTDGTTQDLLDWARLRKRGTTVYRVEGHQNAAVARNVILRNAAPGAVFLVDGDVEINPPFLHRALSVAASPSVAAVAGDLEDLWYDNADAPAVAQLRYGIREERTAKSTGGIIFVSGSARGHMQDEGLRRNEDIDYSLRLRESGDLHLLPVSMGKHHTRHYYSNNRIGSWLSERYALPLGSLLRKHLGSWPNILEILRLEKGVMGGLLLQAAFVLCLLLSWHAGMVAVAALLIADATRFAIRKKLSHFVPIRVLAPWMLLLGFLRPEQPPLGYEVRRIHPIG